MTSYDIKPLLAYQLTLPRPVQEVLQAGDLEWWSCDRAGCGGKILAIRDRTPPGWITTGQQEFCGAWCWKDESRPAFRQEERLRI